MRVLCDDVLRRRMRTCVLSVSSTVGRSQHYVFLKKGGVLVNTAFLKKGGVLVNTAFLKKGGVATGKHCVS